MLLITQASLLKCNNFNIHSIIKFKVFMSDFSILIIIQTKSFISLKKNTKNLILGD